MPGTEIGSSFDLTSPIALLRNALFTNQAGRLASGQLRNTAWDYHEQDTATYWRIKPLALCFLPDGVTQAVSGVSWGTLAAHWTASGSGSQGPPGIQGLPGAASTVQGPAGLDGGTIRYYSAAPGPTDGNVRDMAINTATGDYYEKTGPITWTLRGSFRISGGTGTGGVTTFNSRAGSVVLTTADVLAVVNRANQLAGGLQSAISKVAMIAIPSILRDYGMTVAVYADPTAGNNGRYDLATDLITWVKQGSDVTGQFLPYNSATSYSTSSAYITYPDAVTSALRIFHSLAPAPASTQPVPVNGSNVLSTAWEEISPSAVAVRVPLYQTTGQNTDGAMTQKATSDGLTLKADKAAFDILSATTAAQGAPISVLLYSGGRAGYATLDAALSTSTTRGIAITLNTGTAAITVTNPIATTTPRISRWPSYMDAAGASITVSDGITVNLPPAAFESCVVHNAFFFGPTYGVASTAVLLLQNGTSYATGTGPNRGAQFSDCFSQVPVQMQGGELALNNGYYVSVTGTGTLYLLGSVTVGTIAAGITVVDKRPPALADLVRTTSYGYYTSPYTNTLTGYASAAAALTAATAEEFALNGATGIATTVFINLISTSNAITATPACLVSSITGTAADPVVLSLATGVRVSVQTLRRVTVAGGTIVLYQNGLNQLVSCIVPAVEFSTGAAAVQPVLLTDTVIVAWTNPSGKAVTVTVRGLSIIPAAPYPAGVTVIDQRPVIDTFSVLPYAASIAIDFNAETIRTLAATGNLTFTTVNRALLKTKQLTITNTTAAAITIGYEAWSFAGPVPITALPAGKKMKLTLQCLGPAIADVEAANVLFI